MVLHYLVFFKLHQSTPFPFDFDFRHGNAQDQNSLVFEHMTAYVEYPLLDVLHHRFCSKNATTIPLSKTKVRDGARTRNKEYQIIFLALW